MRITARRRADPEAIASLPALAGTSAPDAAADGPPRRFTLGASRAPLLALVFIAGMTSMALEMCASRLLAPWYGTSLFVWANLIGLVLIYLSVGYFFGGRLADRHPSRRLLCAITAIAALATGLIPFISQPVLQWSVSGLDTANASVFYGSLLAVLALFSVPVTLLGFVSPFAVRLSVNSVGSSGSKAGGLYALSTAGSIIGTFLPVLLLIPFWGVRRALIAACVALLVASLWGLSPRWRIAVSVPGAILLLPLLLPQVAPLGPLKTIPGMIYSQESFYNYIQVVKEPDGTMDLVLNEGQAIHSVYNPNRLLTGQYWDYFLAAPYFYPGGAISSVHRVGVIGLAAGTVAREYTAADPRVQIDGVELDPAIVQVGRKYFGMTEPNLHVQVGDGRAYLRATRNQYDVVAIDAFQQPYIPFQLTTQEFFQEIRAHLSPTGVVCLNTGHTRNDYRLVQAFVNTLSTVFPSVYVFNVPGTFNTEIMATMRPTSLNTFQDNLRAVPSDSLLSTVAGEVLPVVSVGHAQAHGTIFTDDRAPIEQLTDQLILNYLQQGGY
ncbi:MAG TPA: fused MFS/spermidine synthase [Ktedonobacterales bacterium]|nr:fused MFS/spermidine synthase [Ktedonobacterales bacterium]